VKRGVYFSNSIDDPALHIEDLDGLHEAMESDFKISKKVDITFKVIDKYAQSLLLLSSGKYVEDLTLQAKTFGADLDSLAEAYNSISGVTKVPSGIGGAIRSLVVLGGKQYIKSKQAKEIRKFVPAADTLIAVMTTNLLEFLESTNIADLIDNEEKGIKSNYMSFLRQRKASIENERDYLELKSNLSSIKAMRHKTVLATRHLRRAHKKLVVVIDQKKDLTETIAELQDLYEDVKELRTITDIFNSSKN